MVMQEDRLEELEQRAAEVPQVTRRRGRPRQENVTPPDGVEAPPRSRSNSKAKVTELFTSLFDAADMFVCSWAGIHPITGQGGNPERALWRLQPNERAAEAAALAEVVASYPVLQKYLLAAGKNQPLINLAFLNYMIFAPRLAAAKQYADARKAREQEEAVA